MRLLKDNTILLATTERDEFFAVYNPGEKDPESKDRVVLDDLESVDWIKFAFESKAKDEEGSAKQKRIWARAATLIGEVSKRLEEQRRGVMDG